MKSVQESPRDPQKSTRRGPYRSPFGPDVWGVVAAAALYGGIVSEAVLHGTALAIAMALAIPMALFLTGAFT